ncbi:MAG: hypothetical protein V8Q79_10145, partial [Christensenellales bacterium]
MCQREGGIFNSREAARNELLHKAPPLTAERAEASRLQDGQNPPDGSGCRHRAEASTSNAALASASLKTIGGWSQLAARMPQRGRDVTRA